MPWKLGRTAGGSRSKPIGAITLNPERDIIIRAATLSRIKSMSAIALAIAAGGTVKSAKTTVLMSGDEAVAGMKKAAVVAKGTAQRHWLLGPIFLSSMDQADGVANISRAATSAIAALAETDQRPSSFQPSAAKPAATRRRIYR